VCVCVCVCVCVTQIFEKNNSQPKKEGKKLFDAECEVLGTRYRMSFAEY